MADVLGVVKVKLNGTLYRTKPGATLMLGNNKLTGQFGDGAHSGFSEEPQLSEFSGAFEVMADLDTDAIKNFRGIAEYVTDVGITWSAPNCRVVESLEIDPGAGLKFKIQGGEAIQQK